MYTCLLDLKIYIIFVPEFLDLFKTIIVAVVFVFRTLLFNKMFKIQFKYFVVLVM
jgi:hypothetical protein